MAIGAIKTAKAANFRVPQDFSIMGFDDIPESAFYHPPLTTIRQGLYELGQVAVQTFMKLRHPDQRDEPITTAQTVMLQPQLVIREST